MKTQRLVTIVREQPYDPDLRNGLPYPPRTRRTVDPADALISTWLSSAAPVECRTDNSGTMSEADLIAQHFLVDLPAAVLADPED